MYFVLYQLLFLYCICILYCNQSRRTATRDQLSLRRPTYLLTYLLRAVSALTPLVGRHEEHPACKKLIGDVLVWLSFYLSGVRCTADCLHVGPADATVDCIPKPIISCVIEIQTGFTFLVQAYQVDLETRPLNGCSSYSLLTPSVSSSDR